MILLGRHPDQHSITPAYRARAPLGRLEEPLEGNMRLILNIIWLIFGGLWLALGYFLAATHLLRPHHHDSVRLRRVPHRRVRAVAVRLHRRRQARTPPRRADRQRHLADPVRHLAGDRPRDHRRRDGDHDHRHSAGAGESEADPGVADAARQGDRPQRRAPCTAWECRDDDHRSRRAVAAAGRRRRKPRARARWSTRSAASRPTCGCR